MALVVDGKRIVNARLRLFGDNESATFAWLKVKAEQLLTGKISKEEIDASKPKSTPATSMKAVASMKAAKSTPVKRMKTATTMKAAKVMKATASTDLDDETDDEEKEAPDDARALKKPAGKADLITKDSCVDEFMSDCSD